MINFGFRRKDSYSRHSNTNVNVEERVSESLVSSSICGGEEELVKVLNILNGIEIFNNLFYLKNV